MDELSSLCTQAHDCALAIPCMHMTVCIVCPLSFSPGYMDACGGPEFLEILKNLLHSELQNWKRKKRPSGTLTSCSKKGSKKASPFLTFESSKSLQDQVQHLTCTHVFN